MSSRSVMASRYGATVLWCLPAGGRLHGSSPLGTHPGIWASGHLGIRADPERLTASSFFLIRRGIWAHPARPTSGRGPCIRGGRTQSRTGSIWVAWTSGHPAYCPHYIRASGVWPHPLSSGQGRTSGSSGRAWTPARMQVHLGEPRQGLNEPIRASGLAWFIWRSGQRHMDVP